MANLTLKIQVNEKDTTSLKALFRDLKAVAPTALQGVLNKTMSSVRSDVVSEVSAILTASKAEIEKAVSIEPAAAPQLGGAVVVSGRSLPLIAFANRQAQAGVEVQVKKGRAPVVIAGSFVATMRDGSPGIFWREWHDGTAKRSKRHIQYGRLPDTYRKPIRQLFSSSVANIASDQMSKILEKVDAHLEANLEAAVNGMLDAR
jgi:hypothetical protein